MRHQREKNQLQSKGKEKQKPKQLRAGGLKAREFTNFGAPGNNRRSTQLNRRGKGLEDTNITYDDNESSTGIQVIDGDSEMDMASLMGKSMAGITESSGGESIVKMN